MRMLLEFHIAINLLLNHTICTMLMVEELKKGLSYALFTIPMSFSVFPIDRWPGLRTLKCATQLKLKAVRLSATNFLWQSFCIIEANKNYERKKVVRDYLDRAWDCRINLYCYCVHERKWRKQASKITHCLWSVRSNFLFYRHWISQRHERRCPATCIIGISTYKIY